MNCDPAVLEMRGAYKSFGRTNVLHDVHLRLPRGRITAVLGPNGAGKSTLNKILLGLVRPDRGEVRLHGENVTGSDSYRSRIGYMPQAPRFPEHLSARHLLSLVQSLRTPLRDAAASLADAIDCFSLGTFLDRPLGVCSGGQRQRVNAAIALLFDPDVLVLDEPTAGLDPVASASLKDRILVERERGCAVLITSHVLSELEELVDDVVFLLDGRVRYAGSLESLRDAHGGATLERAIGALMTARAEAEQSISASVHADCRRVAVGGAA